jgi:hypothetical protein
LAFFHEFNPSDLAVSSGIDNSYFFIMLINLTALASLLFTWYRYRERLRRKIYTTTFPFSALKRRIDNANTLGNTHFVGVAAFKLRLR